MELSDTGEGLMAEDKIYRVTFVVVVDGESEESATEVARELVSQYGFEPYSVLEIKE